MKRILKITALALTLVLGSSIRNNSSAQYYRDNDITYQTFYDELSPYGQWIDYPGYGYVWVPDGGSDFRPYSTNGHWVWTDDYEWMWVSDYDWGWAPFHYGRWLEDEYYGWIWVPGYEWSPGWVVWRDGGDYYGWAPLRPGINISVNFNIGGYNPPYDYWCFVPRRYIASPRVYDYCVDYRQNVSIINFTTIINVNNYRTGFGFRSGPRLYDAERYCGRINPVRFRESYTPGRTFFRNNEVSVFRPTIRQEENRNIAPRSFERYDRNNADFRNRANNNDFRRNDNGFRREDNTIGNKFPDRRDRVNNDQQFRRNDEIIRKPQDNGNNDGNDQFRRREMKNNDGWPQRQPVQQEQPRQFERRNYDNNNSNNNGNNEGNDQFRRREMKNNDGWPQRQPVQQEQPRQFERRNNDNNSSNNESNDQFRRREMKNNDGWPQRQPTQQVEPKRQEQPRQFERRNDGNQQQDSENRGNGKGRGRGRF